MSKYSYLKKEDFRKQSSQNERIYVGSHTCVYKLPTIHEILKYYQNDITLIIPPTQQKYFQFVIELLNDFIQNIKNAEIVFNDWGIFHWIQKQKAFQKTPIIMGFLLTHQKRDPYAKLFEEQSLMRKIAEDNIIYKDFIEQNNIAAIELTQTLQKTDIEALHEGNFELHIYAPFSFLSTTRYCPFLMRNENQIHNSLPTHCPGGYCEKEFFQQEVKVGDQNINQYFIENAQWYKNPKTPQNFHRIIDNSSLC